MSQEVGTEEDLVNETMEFIRGHDDDQQERIVQLFMLCCANWYAWSYQDCAVAIEEFTEFTERLKNARDDRTLN